MTKLPFISIEMAGIWDSQVGVGPPREKDACSVRRAPPNKNGEESAGSVSAEGDAVCIL